MTHKELGLLRIGQPVYWLGDIEKQVTAIDGDKIECNDGDIHHYSQLECRCSGDPIK
ncbi:MAG: hypothetical protein HPY53_01400 [Brevinematales bacterium]|nr:hypothetical protein [Brevinematales bacterium]